MLVRGVSYIYIVHILLQLVGVAGIRYLSTIREKKNRQWTIVKKDEKNNTEARIIL